jgi:ACS family glucarate transporter-like MFS transporter
MITSPAKLAQAGEKPTAVRWRVVSLLAVMAALTYIDRLNLGVVGKYIDEEFHFRAQTMGWILGSFSLGYAVFHLPGGWLADRFGPRRVMALAILWFSVFTAATAIAPALPLAGWLGAAGSFMVVRFVMGLGEAAALPVGNKMLSRWLGEAERGLGTSIFLAGVGAGGIAGPVLVTWMMRHWGWRVPFLVSGLVGVAVAIAWYVLVSDTPQQHPGVNAAELGRIGSQASPAGAARGYHARIRGAPWRRILSSSSVWGLMLSHFCLVYPVYIFFTWFFVYLVRVRGVTITKASLWTSAPFMANLVMVPVWGWLADRAALQWGKRRGRRAVLWLGVLCSAALLWGGTHTRYNNLALLQLAVAAGFNFAASSVLWVTCNDIAAEFSGTVSGIMTTFGSLGGWLSPIVTAAVAIQFGWTAALDLAALVTLASGLAWLLVDAGQVIA